MTQPGQKFMKTADLVRLAGVKANPVVGEPSSQSLPIPVLRAGRMHVVFLYSRPFARPGQPSRLFPPEYMLTLDATGELIEQRPVTVEELGQTHKPGEIIGTHAMPEGMTYEQFMQKRNRLYHLYDVLLPAFYARQSSAGQEIGTAAKEFKELFRLLSEPPLQPYYRFVGIDFFNWIDRAAN